MAILFKPIALIGPMGCGKSTIGKLLSRKLELEFFDTDECIVGKLGLSIAEIFERFGEEYFRKKEEKIILELGFENNSVVATGGGAIISNKVRSMLKADFFSIYLKADIETIWSRINANLEKRPLINNTQGRKALERIINEREQYYRQANLTVKSELQNSNDDLIQFIHTKLKELSIISSGRR